MYIFEFFRSLVFISCNVFFKNQWNVDKDKTYMKIERKFLEERASDVAIRGVFRTQLTSKMEEDFCKNR